MIPTDSPPVAPHPRGGSDTDKADDQSSSEDGQLSPSTAPGKENNHQTPKPNKDASHPPLPSEHAPSLPNEDAPPLPNEEAPPLPQEHVPQDEDGWDPVWDPNVQAYYFYNRHTHVTQWENPRVPDSTASPAPGVANHDRTAVTTTTTTNINNNNKPARRPAGGYDPSIHGDYDPNADYAQISDEPSTDDPLAHPNSNPLAAPTPDNYGAAATFNRFTGRFQATSLTAEHFNDESRSKRQMNAYFDVDAAANAHDGKSLRAERSAKKLSRKELSAFKKKRKEKKEERRRAWLRD